VKEYRIIRTGDVITCYGAGKFKPTPEQEKQAIEFFKTAPSWVKYMIIRE